MIADFTIRLLTEDLSLLAWTVTQAEARPQGRPRSTPLFARGPSVFDIEHDGIATQLAVHWHDLDVARLTPITPTPVTAGQRLTLAWIEPVWMVQGSQVDFPLAPITQRGDVRIEVPAAALGAVGTR